MGSSVNMAGRANFEQRLFINRNEPHSALWDDGAQRVLTSVPEHMFSDMRYNIDVGSPYNYPEQAPVPRPTVGMKPLGIQPLDRPGLTQPVQPFAPGSTEPNMCIPAALMNHRQLQKDIYDARTKAAVETAAILSQPPPHRLEKMRFRRLEMPFPRASATFDARDTYFVQRGNITKHRSY